MCLETISTTCNSGGKNQGNSERIRTPSTQSLSATSNSYPKLKITKRTNSYTFTDEDEKLASLRAPPTTIFSLKGSYPMVSFTQKICYKARIWLLPMVFILTS